MKQEANAGEAAVEAMAAVETGPYAALVKRLRKRVLELEQYQQRELKHMGGAAGMGCCYDVAFDSFLVSQLSGHRDIVAWECKEVETGSKATRFEHASCAKVKTRWAAAKKKVASNATAPRLDAVVGDPALVQISTLKDRIVELEASNDKLSGGTPPPAAAGSESSGDGSSDSGSEGGSSGSEGGSSRSSRSGGGSSGSEASSLDILRAKVRGLGYGDIGVVIICQVER